MRWILAARALILLAATLASPARAAVQGAGADGIEACLYMSCSPETTTGTISAASSTLTLATAIDFATNPMCLGGGTNCGIVVDGAGASYAIGQPGGFTVSSTCTSQAITGTTTSGSTLVTNVSSVYGVASGDTIASGDSDLPANTTVGAVLTVGPNQNQIGLSATATISETTHFTVRDACGQTYHYRIATYDQNGGVGVPLAAVAIAGPRQLSTFNFNCLDWTRPGGTAPAGYVVWRSLDNVAWSFLQLANAEGSGACAAGSNGPMWDGGQPPAVRPFWVPNDPATIASPGKPDYLRTTLVSGGGTLSLQLANPAGNSVTGGVVAHDDTTGFLSWLAAINSTGGPGHIAAVVTATGDPTVIRTARSALLTHSGSRITSAHATARPFGGGITQGGVFAFAGGQSAAATLALGGNMQEGSSCLPLGSIAGLAVGDFVAVSQNAPGGPTQQLPYFLFSPITQLSCENGVTGVRLADPAGVTFTDAAHTETFTLAGSAASGDVVTIASSSPGCSAGYTVKLSLTDLTSVARGLALSWNALCSSVATPSHTANVVTLQTPNTATAKWSASATHGGGGSETITVATGTGATVQKWQPISNIGAAGVRVDGSDLAAPAVRGAVAAFSNFDTANWTARDLDIVNMTNAGLFGIYDVMSYDSSWSTINLEEAAAGTPNIASYSDFWVVNSTNLRASDISSRSSHSFGPQISSATAPQITGLKQRGALWGRGFKTCAVTGGDYANIESTGAVFDDIALCSGAYRNSFTNIRTAAAQGINGGGIVAFDSWDRFNLFTNFRAVGAVQFDVYLQPTDINNTFQAGDVGNGSGFASVVAPPSVIFSHTNQCALAFSTPPPLDSGTQQPSCKMQSGTWTPIVYGETSTGTAPTPPSSAPTR